MSRREVEIAAAVEDVAARIESTADAWRARWTPGEGGGRLELPVLYGLRRGVEIGRLEVEAVAEGVARAIWTPEESHLEVHRSAVGVLVVAVVPAIASMFWPLWLPLLALLPLATVLGLLAWWLVISRLRTSGPDEFLRALGDEEPPGGVAVEEGATGEESDGVLG